MGGGLLEGNWSGSMNLLVWEMKKALLAALLHYLSTFLSRTCQRGRQATDQDRSLEDSALVSVSRRFRWLRMAANTNRRAALESGEEDIVEIFFVKASNQ